MKKAKTSIGRASLLLLAVVLVAIPLLGIACSDDEDGLKAQFTASPQSGDSPLTVSFTDQSKGDITGWEWDFDGDGVVDSTEQNPTYTYYTPDQWTVSLIVTDAEQQVNKAIKENFINTTGVTYETMELVFNNTYPETDITGKVALKFKEMIEMYTGGNVTVTIHFNATLYQLQEQFEALQSGGADVCLHHEMFSSYIDINMAPIQPTRNILDYDMGSAVIRDPDITQFMVDTYEPYGVRFLNYIDAMMLSGYLSNVDMEDYVDFDGVKYSNWNPGPLDPWEDMFGAIGVYVTQADVGTKVAMGQVDAVGFPITSAYSTGFYQMLSSWTVVEVYAPWQMLMSEATWDDMSPELQELITDTIMPEVQDYASEICIEEHKIAAKGIVDYYGLDHIHYITTSRNNEAYQMVQEHPGYQALIAMYDPTILGLIEAHRPTGAITIAPVVDEILTYAGVPH